MWIQLAEPITGSASAPGNVIIPAGVSFTIDQAASLDVEAGNVTVGTGASLTVAPGASLNVNFSAHHLRVEDGGKAVIQDGGRIK